MRKNELRWYEYDQKQQIACTGKRGKSVRLDEVCGRGRTKGHCLTNDLIYFNITSTTMTSNILIINIWQNLFIEISDIIGYLTFYFLTYSFSYYETFSRC